MFDFMDRITAYDVGVIIGLFIAFFMVRFIWFVCVMVKCGIEMIVMKVLGWLGLETTAFSQLVAAFFRRLGNLMTMFKWTDPKHDFNNGFSRMVDAMYNGTWNSDTKSSIDRDDYRREMWDKIRSSIVWALVLIAITIYADPWNWNLF